MSGLPVLRRVWCLVTCVLFMAATGATSTLAQSGDHAAPGDVVLTVTYGDGSGRPKREITFAELLALPKAGFETTTVWTNGPQTFEGVWLADLVAELGVESGSMEMLALNDYLVDFEVDGLAERKALVAYRHNDELMSPRHKGPLWIVFPYDEGPQFRTEITYVSSIWQLDRIEVLP